MTKSNLSRLLSGLVLAIIGLIYFGCSQTNNLETSTTTTIIYSRTCKIHGIIQKGPFVQGSTIEIIELDASLDQTGKVFNTTTLDDTGSFSLTGKFESKFIEIKASGYYFNEIKNSISISPITLRSICNLSDDITVNVNLLTTITKDRVSYLIKNEQKSFNIAYSQAKQELLNLYNIPTTNISNFEEMDISSNNESNKILLAFSLILQSNLTEGQLSEFLSKLSSDFSTDGVINDSLNLNKLKESSMYLRNNFYESMNYPYISIKSNIINRYCSLNKTIDFPEGFYEYLDSNLNFISDKFENITKLFNNISVPYINVDLLYTNKILSFNNELYLIGANYNYNPVSFPDYNKNYIYKSSDGINWTLINQTSYFNHLLKDIGAIVYKDELWIFGGMMIRKEIINGTHVVFQEPTDDIWSTTDCINWTYRGHSNSWSSRSVKNNLLIYDNKILIVGGLTDGIDVSGIELNDIWSSEDGINWVLVSNTAPFRDYSMYNRHSIVHDNKVVVYDLDNIHITTDFITWSTKSLSSLRTDSGYPSSFQAKMFTFNNNLYLLSNNYSNSSDPSTFWNYDFINDKWNFNGFFQISSNYNFTGDRLYWDIEYYNNKIILKDGSEFIHLE